MTQQVTPSQIQFLRSRPWWQEFHEVHQETIVRLFPGTHIVAHHKCPEWFDHHIDKFQLVNATPVRSVPDKPCPDFDTLSGWLFENGAARVWTGYRLDSDGLWRSCIWGDDADGTIVKIAGKGKAEVAYWGVPMLSAKQ